MMTLYHFVADCAIFPRVPRNLGLKDATPLALSGRAPEFSPRQRSITSVAVVTVGTPSGLSIVGTTAFGRSFCGWRGMSCRGVDIYPNRPVNFSMVLGFLDRLLRIPTSSVMPAREARGIVAKFGMLVGELNDPKRYRPEDFKENRTFSFPLARLEHPKKRVQTALAVTVAELVLRQARHSSHHQRQLLNAATFSSGDLAYFTDTPTHGFRHEDIRMISQDVYSEWKAKCERAWTQVVNSTPNRGESVEGLSKYWQIVDSMLPNLLADSTLAAIRET